MGFLAGYNLKGVVKDSYTVCKGALGFLDLFSFTDTEQPHSLA